jgi:Uma2 family endonuclease
MSGGSPQIISATGVPSARSAPIDKLSPKRPMASSGPAAGPRHQARRRRQSPYDDFMTAQHSDRPMRLTADAFLSEAADAFGNIEVADGLVISSMAQSEPHDLVIRRLAAALENARPADGPCYRVSSDVAVRFADASSKQADHRLNVRYPDIIVRDCDPYDVNTVRDHIHLVIEVTSETTFDADTTIKRSLYASAGIPGYLIVQFDKDWAKISQVEEYRLDWSGRRYIASTVHHRALILDEPLTLTITFEDLQRP